MDDCTLKFAERCSLKEQGSFGGNRDCFWRFEETLRLCTIALGLELAGLGLLASDRALCGLEALFRDVRASVMFRRREKFSLLRSESEVFMRFLLWPIRSESLCVRNLEQFRAC
jgi:hypothetical protein